MAQQNITQTFVIEAYRSLCSYPAKIAVLSGRLQGLGIAIAQAYVMAGMKDINLIDTKEARLLNAKAYLECVAKGLHSKTRIHIHLARNMEPERIASIFFIIRATIGIPDLLLLGYGHQTIHKPVFEYGTDDITQCFTSDIEQKDTLIQNFLAPGTKRKKSLITIAVVSGTNNAGCQDSNISHFLAYAKTYSGHTWFTVHELMYDIASTYRLPGSFASGSLLYNNEDLQDRLSALLVSEETTWLFNTTVVKEKPVVREAQPVPIITNAKLVTIKQVRDHPNWKRRF